tara:strand:+ start:117 stop:341 length:225 start_codon:yes stop_codon:yes gene_type:complete
MRCANFNSIKNKLLKTKKGDAFIQKIDIFRKIIWYSCLDKEFEWMKVDLNSVRKMLSLNKRGYNNFIVEDFLLK